MPLAVLVLITNDHVLKDRLPSTLTGKLSDVAGLYFFPLLLVGLSELIRRLAGCPWRSTPTSFVVAAAATAVGFTLIKTVPAASEAYQVSVGGVRWAVRATVAWSLGNATSGPAEVGLVRDPTDLLTLPAVLGAVVIGTRRRPRGSPVRAPGPQRTDRGPDDSE